MENETNEIKDITHEIARDMTQEAINWDDEYYSRVDSDAIDDLTGQSHTHSVILDAIMAGK